MVEVEVLTNLRRQDASVTLVARRGVWTHLRVPGTRRQTGEVLPFTGERDHEDDAVCGSRVSAHRTSRQLANITCPGCREWLVGQGIDLEEHLRRPLPRGRSSAATTNRRDYRPGFSAARLAEIIGATRRQVGHALNSLGYAPGSGNRHPIDRNLAVAVTAAVRLRAARTYGHDVPNRAARCILAHPGRAAYIVTATDCIVVDDLDQLVGQLDALALPTVAVVIPDQFPSFEEVPA